MFGRLELDAIRSSDSHDYLAVAPWAMWKHLQGPATHHRRANLYSTDTGAQQGDAQGGLEASAAFATGYRQVLPEVRDAHTPGEVPRPMVV